MSSSVIPPFEGKFKSILLYGPPGSGKGTLGKFLSSVGSHFHLSSGDIFRRLPIDSPAGKIVHQYISKGLLVPDEVTIKIWHYYMSGLIATNHYYPQQQLLLLDGIPRTETQVEILKKYIDVQKIILLDVKQEGDLFKRLQKRALIEKRLDDQNPDVFKTRMDLYMKETTKILKSYPSDLVAEFSADQKPLEVLRDVLVRLCDLLA
ncbi:MAG: adenylate kinase [Chlamydiae bacterium]|nr:adenylate kinase [Chlamydiota bacterium]